jgi:hypothetical protein
MLDADQSGVAFSLLHWGASGLDVSPGVLRVFISPERFLST